MGEPDFDGYVTWPRKAGQSWCHGKCVLRKATEDVTAILILFPTVEEFVFIPVQ
jgi:hypothetical protein